MSGPIGRKAFGKTDKEARVVSLSMANVFAGVLFGAIGVSAMIYGKKQGAWRPLVIGAALTAFPYLITGTAAQYITGVVLTAALFVFR